MKRIPSTCLALMDINSILQQQSCFLSLTIPCCKMENVPTSLLSSMNVSSLLNQVLGYFKISIPYSIMKHRPTMLIFSLNKILQLALPEQQINIKIPRIVLVKVKSRQIRQSKNEFCQFYSLLKLAMVSRILLT